MSVDSRFSVVDLSQLGRMYVLETLDLEQIILDRMNRFKELWTLADPPLGAAYDVESLEFDPVKIVEENDTDFELKIRDRVNQACRAVTLAFAISTDLDAIASNFPVGPRQTNESDDRYRRRTQVSLNPTSPHGAAGAYEFWALTADSDLRDASEWSKEGTGEVVLSVMAELARTTGETDDAYAQRTFSFDPRPSVQRIIALRQYILDSRRKAATDVLTVVPPKVHDIVYDVDVWFFPGPDRDALMSRLYTSVYKLVLEQRWIGFDHTHLAIHAALKLDGVYRAEIKSPASDVLVGPRGLVRVTDVRLNYKGRGE